MLAVFNIIPNILGTIFNIFITIIVVLLILSLFFPKRPENTPSSPDNENSLPIQNADQIWQRIFNGFRFS